jgi:hypothetical protein
MKEAASASNKSANFYQTTWRNKAEDGYLLEDNWLTACYRRMRVKEMETNILQYVMLVSKPVIGSPSHLCVLSFNNLNIASETPLFLPNGFTYTTAFNYNFLLNFV